MTMTTPKMTRGNSRWYLACPSRLGWAAFYIGLSSSGCPSLRSAAQDPSTTGDSPNVTRETTGEVQGVEYCAGGARAQACLLGANCRITEAGCQVCQCLAL
jgi:hypothetical protein